MKDPKRFGIATTDKKGKVTSIVEKPANPTSDLAVVGAYLYDNTVFKKMIGQPASKRGEKEITWVNNKYLKEGSLHAIEIIKNWFDIGTIDSLLAASNYMKEKYERSKK